MDGWSARRPQNPPPRSYSKNPNKEPEVRAQKPLNKEPARIWTKSTQSRKPLLKNLEPLNKEPGGLQGTAQPRRARFFIRVLGLWAWIWAWRSPRPGPGLGLAKPLTSNLEKPLHRTWDGAAKPLNKEPEADWPVGPKWSKPLLKNLEPLNKEPGCKSALSGPGPQVLC